MKMRDVKIKNPEFLKLLDNISGLVDQVFDDKEFLDREHKLSFDHRNPEQRRKEGKEAYKVSPHFDILPSHTRDDIKDGQMDPCGMEYLQYQMNLMRKENGSHVTSGFPNAETFLAGQTFYNNPKFFLGTKLKQAVYDISADFLGGGAMALCAFYTPGTFIPWHHNGNAPGYNILLHYNKIGEGDFFTYDNGEILEYPDAKGWSCRAGQFISTAPEKIHREKIGMDNPIVKWSDNPEDSSWHAAHARTNRFTLSTIVNHQDIWEDLIDELEDN
jgi:hypothetical protein